MVKNHKIIAAFIVLIVGLFVVISGCSEKQAPKADKTPSKKQYNEIAIATASAGGAWYPIGAAMAEIINKDVEGTQARVQTTGGGVENVKLVNSGDVEIGITISYLAYNGYNGIEPYPVKMQDIRTMFSGLSTGVLQIVVPANSPIKSIADLKGKKVAVGPAGGGALTVLSDIFKEYGFKFSDITPSYVSYDEGVTMVSDGHVDAAVVYAALPTPAVKTLEAGKHPFRLLGLDEQTLQKLLEKYPYYISVNIPKNMYGLNEDVRAVGTPNIVIVNKNLPDDLVYKITKAFFEQANLDKIHNSHPSAKELGLNNAAKAPVPLHPGAEKFYREKGVLK
ncbi:TRAP transporter solute receptor, TAXI family [Moorella glycerini]|uniref:Aliphatic sulfonates-binding protein n=1 Tax=Neomoorella stamsii TaxID=1266720 RepID=A0A9X7J1T4_9FIRM|nr:MULTISPECIES: TAXI family TRAP transporter solute-binding subunit [Moorella]PRR70656.1 putative aliphatic sulfonates-binding protein precursor [Moorella stamsii]CEP67996.1 TRAP transporter solute receptor, TAXI family [Moorella glycerini]